MLWKLESSMMDPEVNKIQNSITSTKLEPTEVTFDIP